MHRDRKQDVVAGGWGKGMGSQGPMSAISVGEDEKLSGNRRTTVWMFLIALNLKTVKMINFMYIFLVV